MTALAQATERGMGDRHKVMQSNVRQGNSALGIPVLPGKLINEFLVSFLSKYLRSQKSYKRIDHLVSEYCVRFFQDAPFMSLTCTNIVAKS